MVTKFVENVKNNVKNVNLEMIIAFHVQIIAIELVNQIKQINVPV